MALGALVAGLGARTPARAALIPGATPIGSAGADQGQLLQPGGVAFTSSGDIWVADTGNARLQRFTRSGALAQVITGLVSPRGIGVGPDGSLFVADTGAGKIMKFLPDGTADPVFDPGVWPDVRAVAADPRGDHVYAVQGASGRLTELDAATGVGGRLLAGGLPSPTAVAVDASGTIAIVEQGTSQVTIHDPDGSQRGTIGGAGFGEGLLSNPAGVAFDPYGLVVVADHGNGRIQRFTQSGSVVDVLSGLGSPSGVASDNLQSFAVVDDASGRVVFADDVLPPPTLGQTANVARLDGTVTVRLGSGTPSPLTAPQQIRLGAELDTTNGTLRLVTALRGGGTERATISEGRFVVRQVAGIPVTTLSGPQLNSCPKSTRSTARSSRLPDPDRPSGRPKRVVRTQVKGKFKTNGDAASVSVKGTDYEVADYCSGTLVTVFTGSVQVTRKADGTSDTVGARGAHAGVRFVKAPTRRAKPKRG
jgi:sugar lactone lactonase YvrE